MKKILMYDKYDETYREVIDVKELKNCIQELQFKIKNKEVENMFISASEEKLGIIIALDMILEEIDGEVEDD